MNKLITMNKKTKIIVATIFAIIFLAVGAFLFLNKNNDKFVQGKASDYQIANDKVANSKAGFSYGIPQGWNAEIIDYSEGSVALYSPGTKIEKNDIGTPKIPLEKGCLIDTGVIYRKYSMEELELEASYIGKTVGATTSSLEILTISGASSLRYIFESPKTGKANIVYVPNSKGIISFAAYLSNDEGEISQCLKDFGNFLETVSIK